MDEKVTQLVKELCAHTLDRDGCCSGAQADEKALTIEKLLASAPSVSASERELRELVANAPVLTRGVSKFAWEYQKWLAELERLLSRSGQPAALTAEQMCDEIPTQLESENWILSSLDRLLIKAIVTKYAALAAQPKWVDDANK